MIHLTNVSKVYGSSAPSLDNISLHIDKGEFVFLVGTTGSGKTTLLKLLIRELIPTKGEITIGNVDIVALPSRRIPHLRKKIGIIFQDLKLLTDRTIFENVMLPLEIAGVKFSDAKNKVEELLSDVGMFAHGNKFPVQLSGGELQRVAIARALVLNPDILLADEPTGNLDNKTAFEIVDVLSAINKRGTTIVMATHNMDIVKKLEKRVIALEKGHILSAEKEKDNKEEKDEKKDKKGEHKKHGTS